MAYRNVNWHSDNNSDPYKWVEGDTWDHRNEPTRSLIDKSALHLAAPLDVLVADACSEEYCQSSQNVAFAYDVAYHVSKDAPCLKYSIHDHDLNDGLNVHDDCDAVTFHSWRLAAGSVALPDIALAVVAGKVAVVELKLVEAMVAVVDAELTDIELVNLKVVEVVVAAAWMLLMVVADYVFDSFYLHSTERLHSLNDATFVQPTCDEPSHVTCPFHCPYVTRPRNFSAPHASYWACQLEFVKSQEFHGNLKMFHLVRASAVCEAFDGFYEAMAEVL